MIGLDTNVLLRLFVEDDEARRSERARAFVNSAASEQPCLINLIVFGEFAWTLSKPFKLPKAEVIRYLEGLLDSDDLEIERRSAARAAVSAYRAGKADFSDYLLAEVNSELGCTATATFDREASKSKLFSPVP